ncbi:endoplasmic reticulum metallopeptidase 1-like isoform X1 [Bactrocera neohumeralis]|uniref:endoplasmic reticulum metallopeptidase 1-like isoform X1 n=1 Tax=Bactrocera neohumeralis TaxID=98809 RepID=UPI002165D041|nr:endoplasmic reticulum metallopeptidase 1-like isoform X1 [Bactrocera neohumeralis]
MLTLKTLRHWWQHQLSRDGLRDFFVHANYAHFRHFFQNKVAPDEEKEMTYHKKPTSKVPWYLAPAFMIFWLVLIFAVVIPVFFSLPTGLTITNESSHPNSFIAERAERILINFDRIGPKVVGSHANENHTVELLLEQLEAIRDVMHTDLFEMEIDVQVVSGAYIHWTMVNMYQGVQNVVVRFRTKASTSESYLLINSHFDSKPGSPGSGDDGAMVVIMLETLRVIATTRTPFQHPIIFLFNGAEENPLQASHGFITQHKWAKNCKALINLDSAGSGNREVLFQTGPNHPWLMDIYRKSVKRSFASTFAEEIFQSGLIPSDTDFRNFRDYGNVPGLDMAHSYNGYVYHTKFDGVSLVPRGTLQTTGDNILGLVRTFTNSSILKDPSRHAEGHMVFYDFFGYFVVSYTESTGKILNTCVSVGAILLTCISMYLMAADSFVSIGYTLRLFSLIFVLHLIGWILAIALPLLMATMFDSADRSMTWFTSKWLVFGLYICPTLMGLSAPTLLYLSISRNDKVSQPYRLQMVDHAHTLILSIICILLTYLSIRSSYFLMIPLLFHAISLVINMVTTLHKRAYYWSIFVMLCQIIPFLYFTYLFHAQLISTMPMMGRFGSSSNPDLYIAILTILGTMLSMGYLIPLLNIFSRPKLVFLILPAVTLVIALTAMTQIGFPYRPATNVQRVNLQEVRRVFYEYDGTVSRNESGYLFDFQDRRKQLPFAPYVDLEDLYNISDDCDKYMMCGMPIFNHRTTKSRRQASFLPREVPLQLPGVPQLTLLRKSINTTTETIRFEFELEGPSHMSIFVQPLEKVTVSDWSFLADMLLNEPPFHVYFSYGKISTPLTFYIDLKKENSEFDEPLMQLGISGHYISFEHERDAETKKFLATFPSYSYIMEWPSSYERYIF